MNEEIKNEKQKIKILPLLIIFLGFLLVKNQFEKMGNKELTYSEFKEQLKNKNIKSVTVSGNKISGELKIPIEKKSNFNSVIVAKEIVDELTPYHVAFKGKDEHSSLSEIFILLLPTILFFSLWYFILRRGMKNLGGTSGLMSIGKNKAKIYAETNLKLTFKDVAGADEALDELREVIDFLKNADKVKALGGKMPKGILLVGAPGTGKTLIAKAMAGEAGVPFFSCSGSEFVEMFVGVGAARVRDLFNEAKKSAPCVIFIDELDALGKARQVTSFGGNDEKEQTLNQLLVEMDGFDTQGGIIILAATNRPEMIDPALLRSGRFDRQVVVDKPDKKGRKDILSIHIKKTKIDPQLDLEKIAELTPGFSGADLANLVNEAALIATRKNASSIMMDHFTLALERAIAGLEKKNRLLNPKERETVAFHEMGHAMVGFHFQSDDKIHKVSIIPHGIGSMGYTIQRPSEDRYILTKGNLENKLTTLLAGRASEMLIFNELSTGASDDLSKASSLAQEMITKYGMDLNIGFVTYETQSSPFLGIKDPYSNVSLSQDTAVKIDQAIRAMVMDAFHRAYHFLEINEGLLRKCTNELLKKETLNEEELKDLFSSLAAEELVQKSLS